MTATLITKANKGLGYETARRLAEQGHTVYLGARSIDRGEAAAAELGARFVRLDVTDNASVEAAMHLIDEREGRFDVLVNNAGIGDLRAGGDGVTAASTLEQFDTNLVGVVRVTQATLPLLRKSENPVVVNVSSALGSFATVTDPESVQYRFRSIVYSATRAAISMVTVRYAQALPEIKINAVEPGLTSTDLIGNAMGQTAAEGAEAIARLATIGKDGPTGTFRERAGVLPW